jgi:ankyrin repeat protein
MLASFFLRKEFYILIGIGLALGFIPVLIHYSETQQRLKRAIIEGHEEKAREILAAHPKLLNKHDDDSGFTPLHYAIISGRTNLTFWLLARGARANAVDFDDMTPLHKAAVFNRLACAEMLLSFGAQISPLGKKYGALRLAPLHLAAEEGHVEMVKYLLEHGADPNTPSEGANKITPLHMAAAKGRADVVEVLIAAGADIDAVDSAGKTPLAWAIESDKAETADILRAAGAVP